MTVIQNRPSFFIVGAPKSGTTALDKYLSQHPDIFMASKEQHYFGSDLLYKTRTNKDDYMNSFKKANAKQLIGESSVWYLYSKNAAKEIYRFSPDAKIIIMLRDPVNMIHSLHNQNLLDGYEDIRDFEKAFELSNTRKKGEHIPKSNTFKDCLYYNEVALYSSMVKRYLDVFGPNRVHVILYENFKENTLAVYRQVLTFLNVDSSVPLVPQVVNANQKLKSIRLQRQIKNISNSKKRLIRFFLPSKKLREQLSGFIENKNRIEGVRSNMRESTKSKILNIYQNDIAKLEKLINVNLNSWKK